LCRPTKKLGKAFTVGDYNQVDQFQIWNLTLPQKQRFRTLKTNSIRPANKVPGRRNQMTLEMTSDIQTLLGDKAESLLGFSSPKIPKERLHLPGPKFVDEIFMQSNRNNRVLGNLAWMYNNGRLAGTGYLSILPVDQGIEHSGGASFAKNPDYFDPENIIKLAIEGGCNAVA
jgi:DeoC/LacD family aldolase